MKTIDLTIFNDLREEDLFRVAEREWMMSPTINIEVKIRKDQEDQLVKKQFPRWKDGRTSDGNMWKKYSNSNGVQVIKVYETDFGSLKLKVI